MPAFVYEQFPVRVRFGEGAVAELAAEARLAGIRRAMVLSTPEQHPQALMAADLLGELSCAVFDGATMHVPSTVVDRAEALAASERIGGIVAIGGGSTLGLAKALALRGNFTVIAVPTTYAGSEMTDIYGISQDGRKVTGRDRRVRPQVVVYDPALTDTLPIALSVTSGFNAMAHAVEALYAPDTNPVVGLMAQEAVRAMARGLQGLAGPQQTPGARADCLYAAWLAGAALGTTTMGLHHRVCHVLGGRLGLPHAAMHAIVLPYVLRYNAPHIAPTLSRLGTALGLPAGADVPGALRQLGRALGIPPALSALGMGTDRLTEVVDELLTPGSYRNPAPLQRAGLAQLLVDAVHGQW